MRLGAAASQGCPACHAALRGWCCHRWQDGEERSWEPAANVGPELVAAWQETEQHKAAQLRQQSADHQGSSSAAEDRRLRSQVRSAAQRAQAGSGARLAAWQTCSPRR